MKRLVFPALLTLLLLAVAAPICFAADVAASVAPAVQGDGWFTADFVRTVLSVSIGGLISGLAALGLAIISNKNAIKLNQQRIAADKEKLELEFKFKKQEQDDIAKRQRECEFAKEKENHYRALIEILKPNRIIKKYDDGDSSRVTSALLYASTNEYLPYVQRILRLLTDARCSEGIAAFFDNKKASMSQSEIFVWAKLNLYWSALVDVTKKDLRGEKIPSLEECAEYEAKFFEQVCADMKERFGESSYSDGQGSPLTPTSHFP